MYEHKQKQHYVQEHFQLYNLFKKSYCWVSVLFQLLQDKKTQKTDVEDSASNTVRIHQTAWQCILEDTSLNIHCHKNIKSHNERQFAANDVILQ